VVDLLFIMDVLLFIEVDLLSIVVFNRLSALVYQGLRRIWDLLGSIGDLLGIE